jgi:hypothetical protein
MTLLSARRRTSRLPLRINVVLTGKDNDHQTFNEPAVTLDVGKFGARVLTSRKLRLGTMVSVRRANSQNSESFRVVHIGDPDPETRKTPVGLEVSAVEDFWGHSFPADSW